MSRPRRIPGSKNLGWDRVFAEPVGRLTNSAGTDDPAKFAEYDLLLTKLERNDQLDVILAFKRGQIKMAEIAQADREKGLAGANLMATLKLRKNLWAARDELLPKKPADRTTRRNYYDSLHGLEKVSPYLKHGNARLGQRATVADLARVDWPRLQAWWLAPKKEGGFGRSGYNWMHMRRSVSWLLTQLLGDAYHPNRRAIMKAIPTAEEIPREPDLTPDEFWQMMELVTPAVKDVCITLVVSGMRLGEYERCTEFNLKPGHRIQVPGHEGGRRRKSRSEAIAIALEYWPNVERAIPPKRRRLAIQRGFKKAAREIGRGDLHLHDLRHCFIQWGLDEGASIPAAQKAARHRDVRMTMRYAQRGEKGEMGAAVGRALSKGRKRA